MRKKSKPWPEYDEYENYDNETSFLGTLTGEWEDAGGSSWAAIARDINSKFGNERTGPQCRKMAEKEGFI